MNDYYEDHFQEYFQSTFHVDPSSFLTPLTSKLKTGATILDVGCGSGRDLLWLKQRGFEPKGLERSPSLAMLARQASGCEVIEADFCSYDFSREQLDAIVLIGALVHLNREQFPQVLNSIRKAVKTGGYILLSLKEGVGSQQSPDGRLFTLWTVDELAEIFYDLGLEPVDESRQISRVRGDDIWLGYLLRKD